MNNNLKTNIPDDFRLLERFRNGDDKAFEQIYLQWFGPLFHLMKKLTGFENDAKDITQDVFGRLLEKRANIDPQQGVKSYLFAAARNATVDLFRKKRATFNYLSDNGTPNATLRTPDEIKIAGDTELLIEQVIDDMPVQRRQVFELSYRSGFSPSEIVSKLNLTRKSVDNHLYQARRTLHTLLP
jgi:RNA polymerase sigma-70 factor (ECF subfamily)